MDKRKQAPCAVCGQLANTHALAVSTYCSQECKMVKQGRQCPKCKVGLHLSGHTDGWFCKQCNALHFFGEKDAPIASFYDPAAGGAE